MTIDPVRPEAVGARAGRPVVSVLLVSGLFVALFPWVLDLADGEGGQVLLACAGAAGIGAWAGHVLPRPRVPWLVLGVVLGGMTWVATLVYVSARYPGAPVLASAWFVRFGVSVALVSGAAAMCAELLARHRRSVTTSALMAAAAVAAVLVSALDLVV